MYDALPESPFPGLSLSDLPLPQFFLVGGVDHENDDAVVDDDDDDGGRCFAVRSAITTPLLDGRRGENANIQY